jgi:hypothetical protein
VATSQHIFICYDPADNAVMQRIRDNLQRVGLKIWAGDAIEPGSDQWRKQVPNAIRNAAVVVVLMSPAANRSEWVERELDLAKSVGVEILPLMVSGEVHQALLPALAEMEYIDLRADYEANIIQVIRLCYEYRQQEDSRTTTELRQVMADEDAADVPAPAKSGKPALPTKLSKSGQSTQLSKQTKPTHEDVKVFVRQISSVEDIVKPETDEDRRKKEKERRMFLLIATGVVILAVIGGLLAIFLVSGLNPFELGREIEETLAAENAGTEEVSPTTEASPTVEMTVTSAPTTSVPPTATTQPSATPIPPTSTTAPTAIPTSIPPTAVPTTIPPTAIPPTATTIPPVQIVVPTLPPTNTVVPSLTPVATGNIEIMYNGNTLVFHNIGTSDVNLTGIQFILVGATPADSVLFLADEWGLNNNILQNQRCAQVWSVAFSEIPATDPPANECASRSAYRATPRTFWIADADKTVFEIRQNGNVLAQCQAAPEGNETIMRCMVNI